MTLGAAVVNRWFSQHRGLADGHSDRELGDGATGVSASDGLGGGAPGMAAQSSCWSRPPPQSSCRSWRCCCPNSPLRSAAAPGENADAPADAAAAPANPIAIAFAALRKSREARRLLAVVSPLFSLRGQHQRANIGTPLHRDVRRLSDSPAPEVVPTVAHAVTVRAIAGARTSSCCHTVRELAMILR